jgi:hypothetical protein
MFVHGPHVAPPGDDSFSGSDYEGDAGNIVQVGHSHFVTRI